MSRPGPIADIRAPESVAKPPKLYRKAPAQVAKVHNVPDGPFRVAGPLPDKYKGYRWGGVREGRASTHRRNEN